MASSTHNRSGFTDWQHSREAQELTDFVSKAHSFHCLISSNDLLTRDMVTEWSKEVRLSRGVTCIDSSSYLLLREKELTPLQRQDTHPLPGMLVVFDSHRLATHHLDDIIQDHAACGTIRLLLCGNNGLRNAMLELGYSETHMTLLTQHDLMLTHRVLQRLLGEHQASHPDLPSEPTPALLAQIHDAAEGQVSRMETAFTRWLQEEKKPAKSLRALFNSSNQHAFWSARRLATQGVSLALIAGLSVGGWKQFHRVEALAEPSIHQVASADTNNKPYTITLATSYSKKQLVRYQQKHHLPAQQMHVRHVAGKKHRYELDLGSYSSRQAATQASRPYRHTSTPGHHAL